VVQAEELFGREQEASRKPSTGSGRRFAVAVSMRLQALSLSQFHFINPGTDIVPPSETCVDNRYHRLRVATVITR
jgi:hypothetical protein